MNKRGAFTDLFIFLAFAFVIIVFMGTMTFIGKTTYDKFMEQAPVLQAQMGESGNATEIIENTLGQVNYSYGALKWISVMLIFGLALSIFLTSFLVKTNPVFFVPYVLIVIIAVIVAVPLSNTYEGLYNDATLGLTFQGFFGASWIFMNLPIWIAVIGILAGILMFINVSRGAY
jgi:flagellar biosynthesis protein FliQ